MATFHGWVASLLSDLGEPDTTANRLFLEEWQSNEHTTCKSNPLSATVTLPGSTRCKELSHGEYARAYHTHADGLAATVQQLGEDAYKPILDALNSGDPFGYSDWQLVEGALGTWGAHTFATAYGKAGAAGQETVKQILASDAGRSLHAYSGFSTALAHTLPKSLYRARRKTTATLAVLRGKA